MTRAKWLGLGGLVLLASLALGLRVFAPGTLTLLTTSDTQTLPGAEDIPASAPDAPRLLVLAIDGVDRELLYPMLRDGQLPEIERLLGGRQGQQFPHAHLDEAILSTLPSSTLAAWATIFTGKPPAEHGVVGNEYFVRETRTFAAPAPVSVLDPEPVTTTYSDGYANKLLSVPTVYERIREKDPSANAWVSMSQFHQGAEKLLLADRTVIAAAFKGLLEGTMSDDMKSTIYAKLDSEAIETVEKALDKHPAPRVLTVYMTGTDYVAHGSEHGPNDARTRYLREVTDGEVGRLRRALELADAGRPRWVALVSDHGHTEVMHDQEHALGTEEENDPPAVVRAAGFRLRPFKLQVDDDDDFQAVLAYGGAFATVYAADRSTCLEPKSRCDFQRPPRYQEDVIPLAQAFFDADRHGRHAPKMRESLDMILVRKPKPFAEVDAPFEVYLGDGQSEPLEAHLAREPRKSYVRFAERLRELSVGPHGERAGDVLLLARNGDEPELSRRHYFAGLYRSWHGSPSHADSAISCIVAHPTHSAASIQARVRGVFGAHPQQMSLGPLIETLTLEH